MLNYLGEKLGAVYRHSIDHVTSYEGGCCVAKNRCVITCIALTAVFGTAFYVFLRKSKKKPKKDYPRDVVILHQLGRAPLTPNLSPFCLKLETYLRMAKIPYQCEFGFKRSSKGKIPWITYNGQDVADSQFCIDYLNQEFKVTLDHDLEPKEKAIAHALRITSESELFFLLAYQLWYTDLANKATLVAVPEVNFFIRRMMRMAIYFHSVLNGMAAHSQAERERIGIQHLQMFEDIIGDNKFIMGAEAREIDATVFSFLATIRYHLMDSAYQKYMLEKMPKICKYIETMKQEYYPDWNSLITGF